MNPRLKLWRKLSAWPGGKWLFTKGVCFQAPYFSSIKPLLEELDTGYGVVCIRERRSMHNHIGTVHAIALCNAAEIVGGMTTEVSMPEGMRWIPKGMTVRYIKPAKGVLRGTATLREIIPGETSDVVTPVIIRNADGETVFEADITMYVSPKKKSA